MRVAAFPFVPYIYCYFDRHWLILTDFFYLIVLFYVGRDFKSAGQCSTRLKQMSATLEDRRAALARRRPEVEEARAKVEEVRAEAGKRAERVREMEERIGEYGVDFFWGIFFFFFLEGSFFK